MEELLNAIGSSPDLLLGVKYRYDRWHVDVFKTDADRRGMSMTMQIAHADNENREQCIEECLNRLMIWRKYHDEDRNL